MRPDVSGTLHAYDLTAAPNAALIAGIDEAGRGPLFGPVFAACVVLTRNTIILGVDDSKKLTEKKREMLYAEIVERAAAVGIGMCEAREIDEMNIRVASREAMRRAADDAIKRLGATPDVFVIDYEKGIQLPAPALAITHGDALSQCVAAASIVAKVTRDRLMRELSAVYPLYGLSRHKGYGTRAHMEAIRAFGPTPDHRRSFLGKVISP